MSDKKAISLIYESVQSGGPIPGISSGLRQSVCSHRHPQLNIATTTETTPEYHYISMMAPWTRRGSPVDQRTIPMQLHPFTFP